MHSDKPWGGRFSKSTADLVEQFTESVSFDNRLYHADIKGSIAHTKMLVKTKILHDQEGKQIIAGLTAIKQDIERGQFNWQKKLEDIHMNIEAALVKKIGTVGKKLHTARSRNDQVATDLRLYLRNEIDDINNALIALMQVLVNLAKQHADAVMPGFTHLQIAQPVTFGHHMLAWFEMLKRDVGRLNDCRKRVNHLPLGSAALSGTSFPINRTMVAKTLGFENICGNSLDAVSDRDFAIEFCSVAALIMMHLSRFSEELVLWTSQPFQLLAIADNWCTGSSIMPQKKNPDIPELVRGKTARVYGDLMSLLTLMKGQALSYNRDNQEDKEPLFDAIDTVKSCLQIYTGLMSGVNLNHKRMIELAASGHSTATEIADALSVIGIPFRKAHEIVGNAVKKAEEKQQELTELDLADWQSICPEITTDMLKRLQVQEAIKARTHPGGTAPKQVKKAAKAAHDWLQLVEK